MQSSSSVGKGYSIEVQSNFQPVVEQEVSSSAVLAQVWQKPLSTTVDPISV